MKHIHQGGTAITNFGIEQRPIYEVALKFYGKDDLVIGAPMPSMYGHDLFAPCLALHSTTAGQFPEGISDFWAIFTPIRALVK